MAREARSNRGSEQWPVRRSTDEATRSRLRALFIPTDATEGAEVLIWEMDPYR